MASNGTKALIGILMIIVLSGLFFCIAVLVSKGFGEGQTKLNIESEDGKIGVTGSPTIYYRGYTYNERSKCDGDSNSPVPPEPEIPTIGPIPFNPGEEFYEGPTVPVNPVHYYSESVEFNLP